jgi:DNA repair protein RadC
MKPREKLVKHGVRALLDYELIAILLRTGSQKSGVLELAQQVLDFINGLVDIKNITTEDLMTIHGISDAKATTIIAAVELGRRMDTKHMPKKNMILESSDVYHLLKEDLSYLPKEHLIVLCLDIKGHLLKNETVYIGTTSSIQVSVKDIFKSAVRIGCFGIIVVHNHPSGDAKPSFADNQLTSQIESAGKLLTIELIDHIIIGRNEFYSYRKQKMHKL